MIQLLEIENDVMDLEYRLFVLYLPLKDPCYAIYDSQILSW